MDTATPPLKRRRRSCHRRPLQHSFHVLTDGSEYSGPASIFLSVQPTATSTVLRYALTGLSGMTARLAADQKFPLQYTSAVFFPTLESRDGLASLLLTLSQAGAEQLTVCGGHGTCAYAEHIAHVMLSKHNTHPHVRTCEVEKAQPQQQSSPNNAWFCIYEDDYLVVHAKAAVCREEEQDEETSSSTIILVYTLLLDENKSTSFAILPTGISTNGDTLCPLPAFLGSEPLDFVLTLSDGLTLTYDTPLSLQLLRKQLGGLLPARRILSVEPKEWDDGLLIRAQHFATQRHEQWPFLYPYNHDYVSTISPTVQHNNSSNSHIVLTTCTTWHLGEDDIVDHDTLKREIWEKCRRSRGEQEEENARTMEKEDIVSLQPLSSHNRSGVVDENEIDLDDDDDDDSLQKEEIPPPSVVPHLLVLGTGCASPSPQRGSSGYAVFLPSTEDKDGNNNTCTLQLVIVIECGEGYMTNLTRHMPPLCCSTRSTVENQLLHIYIIWISHSHLDHYGGLPCLLRAIRRQRQQQDQQQHEGESSTVVDDDDTTATQQSQNNKRQKTCRRLPMVVAPRKVLEFLNATLVFPHLFFLGMTHAEWELRQQRRRQYHDTATTMPFDYLHSVPVEHCPDAYGLMLGLQHGDVFLCYSGDCRPSAKLIRACREQVVVHHKTRNNSANVLTLLVHEATFQDDELEMARSKRHCTISEALHVARDCMVDATLLTHFSQRYGAAAAAPQQQQPTMSTNGGTHSTNVNYGMCQDGLWLALTQKALVSSNIFTSSSF